jgi:hypothetical protein
MRLEAGYGDVSLQLFDDAGEDMGLVPIRAERPWALSTGSSAGRRRKFRRREHPMLEWLQPLETHFESRNRPAELNPQGTLPDGIGRIAERQGLDGESF